MVRYTCETYILVFVYLPPKDFANLSLTSRAFSDLCSTPTVWRRLCYEQVSPDFSTIRKEFFEGDNNFKELYQNTYKKVCNDCRTFCGETVYKIHQFYLTDTVLCDDCKAKPIYKVISKTDAKKQYKLADSDFALMRCLKASNPFHRSSPMVSIATHLTVSIVSWKHKYNIWYEQRIFKCSGRN